jgi:release factor glutamine methyltransferase
METWTTLKLIEWTATHFKKKGIPSPRLDAEYLLASCIGCKRIDLYTQFNKPIQQAELDRFRKTVERRAKREPLQYILGDTEFYGLPIKVSSDVLIPRPETELLVEETISVGAGLKSTPTILDIGTGSGCIAIALAKNIPEAQITATDQSATILSLARENAQLNNVADQIEFVEADLFPNSVGAGPRACPFNIIVSNPPYIPSVELDQLQEEVRDWEPRSALDGGADGLDIYRRIVTGLADYLVPDGFFIGEIGNDQEAAIRELFEGQARLANGESRRAWCESVEIKKDLAGHPRIVIAKRR